MFVFCVTDSSHSTLLKTVQRLPLHPHSIHVSSSLILFDFSFYLSLHFTIFFLSFLSMHADSDFDSMTNNLPPMGPSSPPTIPPPPSTQVMSPTTWSSLTRSSSTWSPSNFLDFQDSLVHFTPSSDHDVDDETLGKLLAEVHQDYADYRRSEGVSVSPSSMSVMVDRTGKPVGKE